MARTKEETDRLVETSFNNYIDKNLSKVVTASFSANIDLAKIVSLITNLKINLKSKASASLATTGGIISGGVGGTAGGGNNLSGNAGFNAGLGGGKTGKLGGVATGGLSLGASLGTRAATATSASGNISFGTSLSATGSFGPGGKAGFGINKSPISPSMSVNISSSLSTGFTNSLKGSGLSQSEINDYTTKLNSSIEDGVQESFNSSFGPELGYPNARGVQLLNVDISMKLRGPWTAWVETDESNDTVDDDIEYETPSGPFIVDIEGVEYIGTVEPDRSGRFSGKQRIKVVGGSGGFNKIIEAKNYAGNLTKVKTVIDDILRDCGETLSDESDNSFLNKKIQGWHRSKGPASSAMDLICQKIGAEWRVLRDGTVWIGEDEWPEVEPAGTKLDEKHDDGTTKYSMEYSTLVPGIIVNKKKVEEINYKLTKSGLQATLYPKSNASLLNKISERVDRKNLYGLKYRCEVAIQNDDGTVDVIVDDDRMKGQGVGKCAIRVGIPGTVIKVSKGARCLVGWVDGDPSLPYVDDWESGTPFDSIEIGQEAKGAARGGDTVAALFPPQLPIIGTVTPGVGSPSMAFVGTLTIPQPLVGIIQTFSQTVKIGR